MGKTRKARKAPVESATSLPEGTIKGDWVVKKASNGVPRWMPKTSVELNGFKLFTTDIAAKNIGKPVLLYCREYNDTWPKKNAWTKRINATYRKTKFVPNGDALKKKTRLAGWLKTQKPAITKGDSFLLDGPVYDCVGTTCDEYLADGIQVDSLGGKIVSTDLLGTDVFVKA